jgi:hypothetical protein
MNEQLELDLQPVQEYRTIPLTKGQVAIVDAADYEWLNQWKWHALWSDRTHSFYAARATPRVNGKQRGIRMHRVILNAPESVFVDHKNHNTLDNSRLNIRLATRLQNRWNADKQKNNTSGFKGVTWSKQRQRWVVFIFVDGKRKFLGRFKSRELAGAARRAAELQIHGEFVFEQAEPKIVQP